jgi:hypothetical protein
MTALVIVLLCALGLGMWKFHRAAVSLDERDFSDEDEFEVPSEPDDQAIEDVSDAG